MMKPRTNAAACRWITLLAAMLLLAGLGAGCATMPRPIKATLTPLTVVRDVVDMPLASAANGFEYFADHTRIAKAPGAGVGWSWTGGINWGIGYDMSHFLWKGCSWLFGGVDYVLCRSLYPGWPYGISPWLAPKAGWGSLYWPNTRALWAGSPRAEPSPEPSPESRAAAPNAT